MSRTRKSLLVYRNGFPYSPVADFTLSQILHEYLMHSWPLHNARSIHLSKSIMTRAISGLLKIQLFWVAEHSVRPTAPPSCFTTALCCSCTWSIAKFENIRLVLLTWSVPSGILLTCSNTKETESSYHRGKLLKQLHWLPVNYRIQFKLSTLTYRALPDNSDHLPHSSFLFPEQNWTWASVLSLLLHL